MKVLLISTMSGTDLCTEGYWGLASYMKLRTLKPNIQKDDHFTLHGHSLNNLELIPLELINSNRSAIRKAREAFLIYKGKTLEPSSSG